MLLREIEAYTDKFSHGFIPFYEKYFGPFQNCSLNLLEVGIYNGESLKLWEQYFPYANILAIDIQDLAMHFTRDRVSIKQADQTKREEFEEALGDTIFDIAIDDGCHTQKAQQIFMATVFPRLSSGGIMVIEDLAWVGEGWGRLERDNHEDETLDVLWNLKKGNEFNSPHLTDEDVSYLRENISSSKVFVINDRSNMIAFLRKK
jgi:hypothetical protein